MAPADTNTPVSAASLLATLHATIHYVGGVVEPTILSAITFQ